MEKTTRSVSSFVLLPQQEFSSNMFEPAAISSIVYVTAIHVRKWSIYQVQIWIMLEVTSTNTTMRTSYKAVTYIFVYVLRFNQNPGFDLVTSK